MEKRYHATRTTKNTKITTCSDTFDTQGTKKIFLLSVDCGNNQIYMYIAMYMFIDWQRKDMEKRYHATRTTKNIKMTTCSDTFDIQGTKKKIFLLSPLSLTKKTDSFDTFNIKSNSILLNIVLSVCHESVSRTQWLLMIIIFHSSYRCCVLDPLYALLVITQMIPIYAKKH